MTDTLTLARDMSRHALYTTIALAVLNLAVIGPPVQAQEKPSAQELADLHARADAGEATAQHALGFLYRDGLGVPQDHVEAHIWLNLAASQLTGQSRERAVAVRDALAEVMTSAALREAQRRARALHAAQSVEMRSGVQDAPAPAGGVDGRVYRSGWGIVKPRPLRQVNPNYTAEALDEKITGTVYVELVVLPDGTVGDVRITRSIDPVFGLDAEAIKTARQWLFEPGTRFGEPVAIFVDLAFDFTLR